MESMGDSTAATETSSTRQKSVQSYISTAQNDA